MIRVTSPEEVKRIVKAKKQAGQTIGFIPTMGFLHEGHLSLFKKARETSDFVCVSIFVNPTQFGDPKDYSTYPRDIERDAELAEKAGADLLFCPDREAIYPNDEEVTVKVNARTDVLCGASRPGHFDGVATVLTKFFNIFSPDKAYFGLKDAQQVAVVQSLIHSFHYDIELVPCPLVRESDGLAKSSRNVHLSDEERAEAVHLSRGLKAGIETVEAGERDFDAVIRAVRQYYADHLKLGTVDYVDVLNYPECSRKQKTIAGRFIIACAVQYANARLIDNMIADSADIKEAAFHAANIDEK